MLPDGAHLRSEDWTVFYLNQTRATTVRAELLQDSEQSAIDFSDSNDDLAAAAAANDASGHPTGPGSSGRAGAAVTDGKGTGEQQDLLYVMSLVRTKQGSTYKRSVCLVWPRVCLGRQHVHVAGLY